ncbi:MAG: family transposase [Verrucomicrobiales bacterium]|nr:family transposase [Verrucomicrobiales bacterium]
MVVWSHFLQQKKFRSELRKVLPHSPSSPNAYVPDYTALACMGGILCGADKLSRVAWLQSDPALAEVLGVEAMVSQPTLSRFFTAFTQKTSSEMAPLHRWAMGSLPSLKEGYTLDLDSWALLHEDGHQDGVATGYTRLGLKPCHRPLIAALAESKLIANYWLRSGNAACVNGAAEFLRATVSRTAWPHPAGTGSGRWRIWP